MDLMRNNDISNIKNIDESFMKELQDAVNKSQDKLNGIKNLYDEIYDEMDLAKKYGKELNTIINECFENESYNRDFLYVNYDKDKNSYFMDYYSEGQIERTELTKKEMQDYNYKVGSIYTIVGDDRLLEDEDIKTNIKMDIEDELDNLDLKNKNLT